MIILGLCLIVAALLLSGAISGAATALKESTPQPLQQPTLAFLTEYDAADYLGISLNELDYIRSEGLLDGSFVAVTSLEQTGEEDYIDVIDGVEVANSRPVMSNVTRFLFNRQLLDEKMVEAIRNGSHINPFRSQLNKKGGKKEDKPAYEKKPSGKPAKTEMTVEMTDPFASDSYKDAKASEKTAEKTVEHTADKPEEKPAVKTAEKPVTAGPQRPVGPIAGGDEVGDSTDDVIDIMTRINNSGKQGGQNRPNNQNRQGGQNRPNNQNRPNGQNKPNGQNRPNGGSSGKPGGSN